MDEVIIEKQEYLLFDKYKLNTNRNITRYEYISNVPLKVSKREPDMRVCKCGAHLITLAYIFDNNIFRSRTLLGRKCPCCGHNYFTLKTIALCEEAFTIVEYTDLEENIGKEVQVDMYEVKRGDIYFADLTGIEHHCGSEQTGWRPVMIVQNDVGNYYSTTTIIATITSKIKGSQPTHVYLESGILDKDSIVCLEQLKTIDKQRLGRFICNVGDSIMERVNGAIQISLGINNNIDKGVGNKEMKSIFDRISEFRKKKATKKCNAEEDTDIEIDESAVESFDVESMQKMKATDAMSSTLATNRNIESLMGQMDETFSQRLLRLIDERGMTDSEAYNKAYVDRRHFSKIRKDVNYTPNKKTVLAFAIALELSIDEAKDLLNSAGFAFSRSSKTDIIVAYFLQNKIYDMFEINEILDAYGQPIFE